MERERFKCALPEVRAVSAGLAAGPLDRVCRGAAGMDKKIVQD
jgi:hypothetical protein